MKTSLNRWPVIEPGTGGLLVTRAVPGTRGKVRLTLHKDAAPVLLWVAARVHAEVRSLSANNKNGQDDGGYNYRQARNANGFSNHASGTAIDLNWRTWPMLGRRRSMNVKEQAAARAIARDAAPVVAWGGNWISMVDEMHWEIRPGTTVSQLRDFMEAHGIQQDGTVKQ